ncbi:MAG: hypothetical protein SGI92_26195 [Bryobacteraceae bacterium]|nr:hypothetical protein [Bryobacteraceae bacterium]
MPKKIQPPAPEPVIDEEILRKAKLALEADRPRVAPGCVVCGGDAAPTSTENLCWVCRRLKISAWRDVDPQISIQE